MPTLSITCICSNSNTQSPNTSWRHFKEILIDLYNGKVSNKSQYIEKYSLVQLFKKLGVILLLMNGFQLFL